MKVKELKDILFLYEDDADVVIQVWVDHPHMYLLKSLGCNPSISKEQILIDKVLNKDLGNLNLQTIQSYSFVENG